MKLTSLALFFLASVASASTAVDDAINAMGIDAEKAAIVRQATFSVAASDSLPFTDSETGEDPDYGIAESSLIARAEALKTRARFCPPHSHPDPCVRGKCCANRYRACCPGGNLCINPHKLHCCVGGDACPKGHHCCTHHTCCARGAKCYQFNDGSTGCAYPSQAQSLGAADNDMNIQ